MASFPGLLVFTSGLPVTIQEGNDTSLAGSGGGGSDFPVYLGKVVHTNLHAPEVLPCWFIVLSPRRWELLAQLLDGSSSARNGQYGLLPCIRSPRLRKEPPLSSAQKYFNVFNRTPFGLPKRRLQHYETRASPAPTNMESSILRSPMRITALPVWEPNFTF